jgi:hypothetical protein
LAAAYRWDSTFPVPVAVTDRFGNVVDSAAMIHLQWYGAGSWWLADWTPASHGSVVFWLGPWLNEGRYRLVARSPDLTAAVSGVLAIAKPTI